jgi:2-amino-4-hydroxy-6-hydroxymethyldihydropteridine diphosphokinase
LNYSTAYIALGSNLGPSLHVAQAAWAFLGTLPALHLKRLSSPYRSRPLDMDSQNTFINAVGELHTSLSPEALLEQLLQVEQHFGRTRLPGQEGYQDRSLDLDLLFFADCIRTNPTLILPHPALARRIFVLAPMEEIAPHFVHPLHGVSIAELRARLAPQIKPGDIERVQWPKP